MRLHVLFVLLLSFPGALLAQYRLVPLWETTDTLALRTPEAVLFDAVGGKQLFVACMGKTGTPGDGYIAVLGLDGRIKQAAWVTGLDDPKGMALRGDTLWVADLSQLVAIHRRRGTILQRVPISGATFLNDLSVDARGMLYASDTRQNRIHLVDLKGQATLWRADTTLGGPNGLKAIDTDLIVAGARSGQVSRYSVNGELVAVLATGLPRADGIVNLGPAGLIVSTWTGTVHHIAPDGQNTQLLDLRPVRKNTADLDWNPMTQVVYIPTFFGHTVAAYQLQR